LPERHLLARRRRGAGLLGARLGAAAAQHLLVLGDEDALAAQDEPQPLRALGVLGPPHGLSGRVEALPGIDRHLGQAPHAVLREPSPRPSPTAWERVTRVNPIAAV